MYHNLPTQPGVYLFKDKNNHIIYIGKAKNLQKRVASYFRSNQSYKTTILAKRITSVDHIIVNSEVEALLLENKLIKKHTPKYNILLKDSKTFAYIHVTDDQFPRVYSTRRLGKKGTYFGPYTSGNARVEIVRLCNELFQLRTCKTLPKRACLNYHIGLCSAPCINEISEDKYKERVIKAKEFLKGKTTPVLNKLKVEMKQASHARKYEIALEKRRQIEAITILDEKQHVDLIKKFDQDIIGTSGNDQKIAVCLFSISKGVISGKKEYLLDADDDLRASFVKMYYSTHYIPSEIIIDAQIEDKDAIEKYLERRKGAKVHITVPLKGDKKRLVEMAQKNALFKLDNKTLKDIQRRLNLPVVPRVIECFDMSNLGFSHHVGAMVQYKDGKSNNDEYRRYKIKQIRKKNDDFASMREVIYRRYKFLQDAKMAMPDLILVDGGKGQLSSALESLQQLGLKIPIVGLAKKNEELFLPHESDPRVFPQNSSMMLLMRQMRNEVHRYAIRYNRKRREMEFKENIKL